jgi:hypothetical protein
MLWTEYRWSDGWNTALNCIGSATGAFFNSAVITNSTWLMAFFLGCSVAVTVLRDLRKANHR